MGSHGLSVHGTSVVAEAPGPGFLRKAGGVDWTDIVGYRRGWGNTFSGVKNTFNWFHFAVPSLNLDDHASTDLTEVRIHFLTTETAAIKSVHLWDAHVQIRAMNNLNGAGDYRAQITQGVNYWLFAPPLNMQQGALGISVGVDFGARDSDVLFTTAYALFTT